MRQKTKKPLLQIKRAKGKRIALLVSRYNVSICEGLLKGALKALKEVGLAENQIEVFRVPGAFEMPYQAQKCAVSKKFSGLVALGAVVRGGTPHFEYVCKAATEGLMRVMLDYQLPVGFGLLTTDNLEQALERSADDDYNKGREAALTVYEMMQTV